MLRLLRLDLLRPQLRREIYSPVGARLTVHRKKS